MKKKKADPLTLVLYAIIVFAVLYVSAALGAAMDISVDDEGVLDFSLLMSQFETVLTKPDVITEHFTDFSGYSAKITVIVGIALGIYVLMKYTSKKRLHRKGAEPGDDARPARQGGQMRKRKNFSPTNPKKSIRPKPLPMRTGKSTRLNSARKAKTPLL